MNDRDIQGPPPEAARPRLLDLAREAIRRHRRHENYLTGARRPLGTPFPAFLKVLYCWASCAMVCASG